MPYIQCKDGVTYSRYDSHPYVEKCIKDKREEQLIKHQKCMASVECRKEYEVHPTIATGLFCGVGFCLAILVGLFIYIIHNDIEYRRLR